MIGFVLESIYYSFDILLSFLLCGCFLEKQKYKEKKLLILISAITAVCILNGYINNIQMNQYISSLLFVVSSAVLLYMYFEEEITLLAGFSAIYIFAVCVLEFIILMIAEHGFGLDGFIYGKIIKTGFEKAVLIIITRLLIYLLLVLLEKRKIKIDINRSHSLTVIALGVIGIICMQYLMELFIVDFNANTRTMILVSFGFMISFFVSLIIVLYSRQRYLDGRAERILFETKLELSEERNRNTIEAYSEIARLSHDYKNHFQIVSMLLEKNELNEAEKYISKIVGDSPRKIKTFLGIPSVDAVLSAKCETAQKNNIEFECRFYGSYPENIEKNDLCTILLNLLDNALEACMNISVDEKRFVKVSSANVNRMYLIKVENTFEPLLEMGDTYATSKKDRLNHGYGLKIVESLADRYNGCVNISKDNGVFRVIVLLNK